jgi:autotransporter-associated beta strand protein
VNVSGSVTSTNVSNSRFLNLNGGVLQVGTSVFSPTTGVIVNFNGGTLKSGNAGGLTFESTITTSISNHTTTVQFGGATLDTTNGSITSTAVFNGTVGGAITVKGGNIFTSNVTNSGVFNIEDNSIWDLGSTGGASAVFLNSSVGGLSGNGSIVNSSGIDGTLTIDFADFVGPFTYSGNLAPVVTSAISLIKNGTGTQILSGVNTYTGTTTVTAGTLLVGGSISGSATTVDAAGTIGAGSAANTIGTGTTGKLTFLDTGTLQLDLSIASATTVTNDLLNVIGDLNLDGDLSLSGDAVLVLQNLGADIALNPGTSFTFIDYSGLWDGKTFAGLTDDSVFSFGANQFRISYNGVSGTDTAVTLTAVVPEPNGAVMLLGGIGFLHLGKRRARTHAPAVDSNARC